MDKSGTLILDRVTASLALAVLAVVGAGAFLLAAGAIDSHALIHDSLLRDRLLGFADGSAWQRVVVGGVGLAVGLLGTGAIVSRFGSTRSRPAAHVIERDDDGTVLIERDGIAHAAEAAVARCRGVLTAEVSVRGALQGPVQLRVNAGVHGGANLQQAGRSARTAARSAVEQLVGLDVSDVTVQVGVLPLEGERGLA